MKNNLSLPVQFFVLALGLISCAPNNENPQPTPDAWQPPSLSLKRYKNGQQAPLSRQFSSVVNLSDRLVLSEPPEELQIISLCAKTREDLAIQSEQKTQRIFKKISEFSVGSLLPVAVYLESWPSISCQIDIIGKNTIGSTVSYKLPVLDIVPEKNTDLQIIKKDGSIYNKDDRISESEILVATFLGPDPLPGTLKSHCEQLETALEVPYPSSTRIFDVVWSDKESVMPPEDSRRTAPLQYCVFSYEENISGRVLLSSRYLISFSDGGSYQDGAIMHTDAQAYPRDGTVRLIEIRIQNDNAYPIFIGYKNAYAGTTKRTCQGSGGSEELKLKIKPSGVTPIESAEYNTFQIEPGQTRYFLGYMAVPKVYCNIGNHSGSYVDMFLMSGPLSTTKPQFRVHSRLKLNKVDQALSTPFVHNWIP